MSTEQPPTYLAVPVRGAFYRSPDEREIARMTQIGYPLVLEREPANPYDKNALKALTNNGQYHVGYIGREYAQDISPWIDKGWTFLTTVTGKRGQNLYVKLEPILPTTTKQATETLIKEPLS